MEREGKAEVTDFFIFSVTTREGKEIERYKKSIEGLDPGN